MSQHKLTIEQGIPHRALNYIYTAHATKRDRGTVCRRTDGLGRLAARGVEGRKRGRGRGIRVQRRGGEEWREGEFGWCCLLFVLLTPNNPLKSPSSPIMDSCSFWCLAKSSMSKHH